MRTYYDDGINWKELLKDKQIYIYGLGHNGYILYERLKMHGISVVGGIDNDLERHRDFEKQYGMKIYTFAQYKEKTNSNDFIIISTHFDEIRRQLVSECVYNFVTMSEIDLSLR